MLRLLYVSESTLLASEAGQVIDFIVDGAIKRNSNTGVTGALLYSGNKFAQALEGDDCAVTKIMESIYTDSRHCRVTIVDQDNVDERRFAAWSMAYYGPAMYIANPIARLLTDESFNSRRDLVSRIYQLMEALGA